MNPLSNETTQDVSDIALTDHTEQEEPQKENLLEVTDTYLKTSIPYKIVSILSKIGDIIGHIIYLPLILFPIMEMMRHIFPQIKFFSTIFDLITPVLDLLSSDRAIAEIFFSICLIIFFIWMTLYTVFIKAPFNFVKTLMIYFGTKKIGFDYDKTIDILYCNTPKTSSYKSRRNESKAMIWTWQIAGLKYDRVFTIIFNLGFILYEVFRWAISLGTIAVFIFGLPTFGSNSASHIAVYYLKMLAGPAILFISDAIVYKVRTSRRFKKANQWWEAKKAKKIATEKEDNDTQATKS